MNTQVNQLDQRPYTVVDLPRVDLVIQPLAQRSMFWRPLYLEQSAWLEHIPFAFWLVQAHRPRTFVELGSHWGVSYFAFCQAVERLGFDTRCFAVDTWKGDEHAGLYDERVFEKVKAHNDTHYSAFSRLVRSTFDEALKHFEDASIDLLHIDGLHTLEAVRHDFETWLPKMSSRGVVIFHDTNVRERNFGVFRLFESLKQNYPHFEFVHGHGLGVLAVGHEQNELMERLFAASAEEHARQAVHEVFSRLGRACADTLEAKKQKDKVATLTDDVTKQKKQVDELKQSLEKTKGDLKNQTKELADAKTRLQTQLEQHAVERGQLAERVTLLQELRAELKAEVARLQGRIDHTTTELTDRIGTLHRLELNGQELQRQLGETKNALDSHKKTLGTTKEELEKHKQALNTTKADLEKTNQTLNSVNAELEHQRNARVAAEAALHERQQATQALEAKVAAFGTQSEQLAKVAEQRAHELKSARDEVAIQKDMILSLQKTLAEHDAERALAREQIAELEDTAARLQEDLRDKQAEVERLQWHLGERDAALASREKELNETKSVVNAQLETIDRLQRTQAERDAAINRLQDDLNSRRTEIEKLQWYLGERDAELARRAEALVQREREAEQFANQSVREREQLHKELIEQQERAAKLQSDLRARNEELSDLRSRFETYQQMTLAQLREKDVVIQHIQTELEALRDEKQTLDKKLDERFKELATLTNMLEERDSTITEKGREAETQAKRVTEMEGALKSKDSSIKTLQNQLDTVQKSLQSELKEKSAAIAKLESENRTLLSQKQALEKNVEVRFKELAVLTGLLEEKSNHLAKKEEEVQKHIERVSKIKSTVSWKATAPFRAMIRPFRGKRKESKSIQTQIEMVKKSGLFDRSWYLERYPDVETSGADPIEHYIRFGAAEGRDPGPGFDTKKYVGQHPSLLSSGVNPLVHYIKHR